jgi:hypothetical protein
VHYDNPSGLSNAVDSSGVRIQVTDALRPMDAGIFMMGALPLSSVSVPPGRAAYGLAATCPAAQTLRLPPAARVNPTVRTHACLRNLLGTYI